MQLPGASVLKETYDCAQAGESPQLMREPLGGLGAKNHCLMEGGFRVAAPELPTAAASGIEGGVEHWGWRLTALLHSGF